MPNAQIWYFWPKIAQKPSDILTAGAEGAISQVPQGSKGKSFQDILRGHYRCEIKKTSRAYLILGPNA